MAIIGNRTPPVVTAHEVNLLGGQSAGDESPGQGQKSAAQAADAAAEKADAAGQKADAVGQKADNAAGDVTVTAGQEQTAQVVYPQAIRNAQVSVIDSDDPYKVTQAQRDEATKGADERIAAFRKYIDELPALETKEDREKRERRERSKRIIGAISDGVRAMSNLYYTTQYAPDMYRHEKTSQLNATDERIERLRAEREKNRDAYLKFSLGLGDAEAERIRTLRELEADAERHRIAAEKAKRDKELHPITKAIMEANKRKAEHLADKAGSDAGAAKIAAYKADEYWDSKIRKNNRPSPQGRGGGGGQKTSTWNAVDPKTGDVYSFQASSEANAHSIAGAKGWQITGKITESEATNTKSGRNSTRTTTKTSRTGDKPTAKSYEHTKKLKL